VTTNPPQLCNVLPWEAREALRRAAATQNTTYNPMAREIAIEAAIARVKIQYPQFFKKEH